jgi:hydroxyacylglutathione hydrolase
VDTLKRNTGCTVVGSDAVRIRGLDTVMKDGDVIELADVQVGCIATPGHTASSVCFFVSGGGFQGVLFSGDTLFVCGCGRMFECDGETMYQSLQRLTALPDETLVCPGHDYTEENVEFALTVHPGNAALQEKLEQVRLSSASGQPTVPSTLAEEKKLNPFLTAADWKTFATLRRKKDVF